MAQLGRALRSGRRGRRFKSCHSDLFKKKDHCFWAVIFLYICQACEEDGSPAPVYTAHPGDIMIRFTASENRVLQMLAEKVTDGERVIQRIGSGKKGYWKINSESYSI